MIELGCVSTKTKGRPSGFYLDNPCEPDMGWSQFSKQCP